MNKFISFFILLSFLHSFNSIDAQENKSKPLEATLGIGAGIDYSGYGINLMGNVDKHLAAFASYGYNSVGWDCNGGLKYKFFSANYNGAVNPFIIAMYGYNGALKISGDNSVERIFYGPTVGIGLDSRNNDEKKGYWSFGLLVPIRPDFYSAIDYYKNQGATFSTSSFPFTLTIGYRIKIFKSYTN